MDIIFLREIRLDARVGIYRREKSITQTVELDLDIAGEFLVMAATLLQIKSKMLLPADETAADEEDGPDPREELVRRLLEYKQFKDAARQLDEHERLWREIYSREQSPAVDLA